MGRKMELNHATYEQFFAVQLAKHSKLFDFCLKQHYKHELEARAAQVGPNRHQRRQEFVCDIKNVPR